MCSPEVPRQIPLPLRTLLERCFSDHPEDRPSAENVAKAADAGLASDGIATESPRPSVADIMSALLTLGFPVAGVVRAFQRRLAQVTRGETSTTTRHLPFRRGRR